MIDANLRGLYAITDEKLIPPERFTQTIELALTGGAHIVQYRDKSENSRKQIAQAGELRELCDQYNALLIINDNITLAKKINADGIHLGESDANIKDARSFLGNKSIIGISCYNQLDKAVRAQQHGVDYVAFGAAFPSRTKPDACKADISLFRQAKQQLTVPVCAIGGINIDNAKIIVQENIDMIAVVSSLFASKDILATARALRACFKSS